MKMYLLRAMCFGLLLSLSSQGTALTDPYFSQAIDIDYALEGENETIRAALERTLDLFLRMVIPKNYEDEEGVHFTPSKYYDADLDTEQDVKKPA